MSPKRRGRGRGKKKVGSDLPHRAARSTRQSAVKEQDVISSDSSEEFEETINAKKPLRKSLSKRTDHIPDYSDKPEETLHTNKTVKRTKDPMSDYSEEIEETISVKKPARKRLSRKKDSIVESAEQTEELTSKEKNVRKRKAAFERVAVSNSSEEIEETTSAKRSPRNKLKQLNYHITDSSEEDEETVIVKKTVRKKTEKVKVPIHDSSEEIINVKKFTRKTLIKKKDSFSDSEDEVEETLNLKKSSRKRQSKTVQTPKSISKNIQETISTKSLRKRVLKSPEPEVSLEKRTRLKRQCKTSTSLVEDDHKLSNSDDDIDSSIKSIKNTSTPVKSEICPEEKLTSLTKDSEDAKMSEKDSEVTDLIHSNENLKELLQNDNVQLRNAGEIEEDKELKEELSSAVIDNYQMSSTPEDKDVDFVENSKLDLSKLSDSNQESENTSESSKENLKDKLPEKGIEEMNQEFPLKSNDDESDNENLKVTLPEKGIEEMNQEVPLKSNDDESNNENLKGRLPEKGIEEINQKVPLKSNDDESNNENLKITLPEKGIEEMNQEVPLKSNDDESDNENLKGTLPEKGIEELNHEVPLKSIYESNKLNLKGTFPEKGIEEMNQEVLKSDDTREAFKKDPKFTNIISSFICSEKLETEFSEIPSPDSCLSADSNSKKCKNILARAEDNEENSAGDVTDITTEEREMSIKSDSLTDKNKSLKEVSTEQETVLQESQAVVKDKVTVDYKKENLSKDISTEKEKVLQLPDDISGSDEISQLRTMSQNDLKSAKDLNANDDDIVTSETPSDKVDSFDLSESSEVINEDNNLLSDAIHSTNNIDPANDSAEIEVKTSSTVDNACQPDVSTAIIDNKKKEKSFENKILSENKVEAVCSEQISQLTSEKVNTDGIDKVIDSSKTSEVDKELHDFYSAIEEDLKDTSPEKNVSNVHNENSTVGSVKKVGTNNMSVETKSLKNILESLINQRDNAVVDGSSNSSKEKLPSCASKEAESDTNNAKRKCEKAEDSSESKKQKLDEKKENTVHSISIKHPDSESVTSKRKIDEGDSSNKKKTIDMVDSEVIHFDSFKDIEDEKIMELDDSETSERNIKSQSLANKPKVSLEEPTKKLEEKSLTEKVEVPEEKSLTEKAEVPSKNTNKLTPKILEKGMHFCKLCNKFYNNIMLYIGHMQTPDHQAKVKTSNLQKIKKDCSDPNLEFINKAISGCPPLSFPVPGVRLHCGGNTYKLVARLNTSSSKE